MQAIEFKLSISKIYLTLITIIFLMSAGVVLSLSVSVIIKAFLLLIVIGYGVYLFWFHGCLKGKHCVQQIKMDHDRNFYVWVNQAYHAADLMGRSFVTSHLCVLNFKIKKFYFTQSAVIFFDAMPAEHYRKLLVALRN